MIRRVARVSLLGVLALAVVGAGIMGWFVTAFAPTRSVVYREVEGTALELELFLPDAPAPGPRPAILFFFGGGWMGGSTAQFHPWAKRLAQRGWVAATADYRVFSRHGTTAFSAVDDAEQAYRYLRDHADALGIDPARIVLAGGSAGGHLAAVSGIIAPARDPALSPPAALVLLNPALDTKIDGDGHYLARVARLFEGRGEQISPIHHVRPGVPPTLVVHGSADDLIPIAISEAFCRRMRDAGNTCRLLAWPGAGHGFFNYGLGRFDEVFPEVADFLEGQLAGAAGARPERS